MIINKDTKIIDILKASKNASKVLDGYGLYCATCKGAEEDSLGKIASSNGLDLNRFIDDIKKSIQE
jgi:hypothetical protein